MTKMKNLTKYRDAEVVNVDVVSSTKQSKIVKYKLEEDTVTLRASGLSFQQIADELNLLDRVPKDDLIDKHVVMRFLEKIPAISKQLVQEDKKRMIQVVSTSMDIVQEVVGLFHKTKTLLEDMEEKASNKKEHVNPYQYKAIASEMREMLRQMTEIQKEINDADNIRMFMEVVLTTLKEECPDKLPIIANKLKMAKGTQWFADMINKGN